MPATQGLCFNNDRIEDEGLVPVKCIKAPPHTHTHKHTHSGLDCCPFYGGCSVVVESLLIAVPIVYWRFCVWFLYCFSLLCVLLPLQSS